MTYEADKLVSIVYQLCHTLQRPVSSKDVSAYYRLHPGERPLLMQAPGQTLFKLSRRGERRIHRSGLIGNLAFYAPSRNAHWRERFTRHRASILVAEQCLCRFPEHALPLLNTRFDSLVRNSLAGYVEEFSPLWKICGKQTAILFFEELLALAKMHAAPQFVPLAPSGIMREEAASILRAEYCRRTPLTDPDAMNVNRHLANLYQSPLLKMPAEAIWRERVELYCAARWPLDENETQFCRGLSLAMRYGDVPA